MNSTFNKLAKYQAFALLITALVFVGVFSAVWLFAPEVGGNWWPYIRFVFSFVSAVFVTKIFAIIFFFIVNAIFFKNASSKLLDKSFKENGLDDDDAFDKKIPDDAFDNEFFD